ncbi:hypothetical protein ACSQ67_021780 [Phaseolus vulgaris]
MASISQGLVFTSAMLFSTTLLYLAFSKHKSSPQFQIPSDSNKQILRSCIYSVERDSKEENREEQGRQNRVSASECKRENPRNGEIPANRVALYNGILRDRGQRMACCH